MNVFITGAGGFIGRVLTKHLLDQGCGVSALVRKHSDISFCHKNLRWYVGDIRDADFLVVCMDGVEIAIHLAAAKSDESDSYEVNVTGTKNFLDACNTAKVRGIINVSTISTKFAKKGLYGVTKQAADDILKNSRIPVVIVKPSVIYGDSESGIFGTLIRYTKLPVAPVIGAGLFMMRPLHVRDMAIAIEKILSHPFDTTHTIYDLGGPDSISFNDLVRLIGKVVHNKSVFLFHIPVSVGYALAKVLGMLFKRPPITVSNVIATNQEAAIDHKSFYKTYNFRPRSLKQGLKELKEYGELCATEPYMLLSYLLGGKKVGEYQVKLFKQAVIFYGLDGRYLSKFIMGSYWRIGALDAVTKLLYPTGVFQRKLLIAAALVECSPLSSDWLLPQKTRVDRLVVKSAILTFRSVGKLALGVLLLCIPNVYKNNV